MIFWAETQGTVGLRPQFVLDFVIVFSDVVLLILPLPLSARLSPVSCRPGRVLSQALRAQARLDRRPLARPSAASLRHPCWAKPILCGLHELS